MISRPAPRVGQQAVSRWAPLSRAAQLCLGFEALGERSLALNKLAPHLAKPVPFLYPLMRPVIDRGYGGLGIGVYDVLGAGRGVPHHMRHLSRKRTFESFPSASRETVIGSIRFYEGQVDDARHTMMIGRTAAHYGAAVATSTRVVGFLREADRVAGVMVRDLESGREFTIRAKQTINAAGVWIDELQEMLGGRGQFRVRASKGVHLVVPRNRINSMTGLITRTEKSLLFIIPWGSHWIIGTTDTDWRLDKAHPAASVADIDYLLLHANTLLADPLKRRTSSASTPVCGRCWPANPTQRPSFPGSTPSPRPPWPGHDSWRQVHHLPSHGQGRR